MEVRASSLTVLEKSMMLEGCFLKMIQLRRCRYDGDCRRLWMFELLSGDKDRAVTEVDEGMLYTFSKQ